MMNKLHITTMIVGIIFVTAIILRKSIPYSESILIGLGFAFIFLLAYLCSKILKGHDKE